MGVPSRATGAQLFIDGPQSVPMKRRCLRALPFFFAALRETLSFPPNPLYRLRLYR